MAIGIVLEQRIRHSHTFLNFRLQIFSPKIISLSEIPKFFDRNFGMLSHIKFQLIYLSWIWNESFQYWL